MECKIFESKWDIEGEFIIYKIRGNRFLRGMVKALTATMLKIGRHKITIEQFQHILEAKSQKLSSFAVPSQGLFLEKVIFPEKYF